jgi:periplasmic protein CpxP/Spy
MLLSKKKFPALLLSLASLFCLSTSVPSFAQDWQGPDRGGGPMEHVFRGGERGRWWDNPEIAQQIGLTDDQKKQMHDIFQQHRLQLIDLNATLEKDEVLLRPLLEADQLDEAKILSQIDAIAQARADLEKANARMLFGIRKVLTPDQWKKVQALARSGPPRGMNGDHRVWRGPDSNGWHHPDGPNASKGPDGDGNGAPPAPPQAPPNQ